MSHLSRRGFLGVGIGMAVTPLLPGCDVIGNVLGFDSVEMGDAHLVWDIQSGSLYRVYPEEHAVSKLSAVGGSEVWRYGELGEEEGQLNNPENLVPNPDGSLYIVDRGNDRIVKLNEDGSRDGRVGAPGSELGQLRGARDAVCDADGTLWVADTYNHRVQGFNPDGSARASFGELDMDGSGQGFNSPRGIAYDREGLLHVVDSGNARVNVYETNGNFVRSYGELGEGVGRMQVPRSVALDPFGNSYVADSAQGSVQVFGPQGTPVTRFNQLSVAENHATPLEVKMTDAGLLYVRVISHRREEPPEPEAEAG